ncbi:c-type cytochrome [Roseovarius autotrophicus]|uniref:c-type cytochrome n=1 Tax=Roseovarius autotrophicus TaxID=2824121 RepID=UPI0019F0B98C|nr:cytochrome c family protein [Roseovarius autotrophicus]MBE0454411.1 cytochrome c family protein [Roseovarius sp.]
MKRLTFASICLAALPVMAAAEGDAANGEKVFNKCKACHMVGDDAKNRVGPELNGIVGRAVGAVEGFAYSDTLKEMGASGAVWSEDVLAAFLEKPRDFAKGTKMAFPGLRKEEERADVIAYLATFSE